MVTKKTEQSEIDALRAEIEELKGLVQAQQDAKQDATSDLVKAFTDALQTDGKSMDQWKKENPGAMPPGKPYRRQDHPPEGHAWHVRSPNPEYFERTCSIKFYAGQAIVTEDHPDADNIIRRLEGDFGYAISVVDQEQQRLILLEMASAKVGHHGEPDDLLSRAKMKDPSIIQVTTPNL